VCPASGSVLQSINQKHSRLQIATNTDNIINPILCALSLTALTMHNAGIEINIKNKTLNII
jgi:hypothetical protein